MQHVKFEKHESCPACGSRDNLGLWSDGHVYCFGCHYRRGPRSDLQAVKRKFEATPATGVALMPEDVSTYIPEVPYSWLMQWLTNEEIIQHRIGWSASKEAIVFPVFDPSGNLLMWQSRYFGDNKDYPKYLTKGNKGDILHVLGDFPSNRVTVVEDLISAIVVSRVDNAMPLWGSSLNLGVLKRLASQYPRLGIWLDSDKLEVALKAVGRAKLIFEDVQVFYTPEDPKYHSVEQVEKILGEGIDKRDKS